MVPVTKIFLILAVVFHISEGRTAESEEECRQKLQNTLIPNYANSTTDTLAMQVTYSRRYQVQCGTLLGFIVTITKPVIKYDIRDRCENATVIFMGIPYNIYDLDTIVGFPFLHWKVNNVPTSVLASGFSGQVGDAITDYLFPLLPLNDHRYTFLVYCQSHYIVPGPKKNSLILDRPSFNPRAYADLNDLGNPQAINYFVSVFKTGIPFPPSPVEVDK